MSNMSASELIDQQIAGLPGWRGQIYTRLRTLVREADPQLTEEWKWDTAVWANKGMVCSVGAFKDHMKLNFFKGASLPDPHKLFNSGLEAKNSRSIDFHEGDTIDEPAIKDLIRAASAYNKSK